MAFFPQSQCLFPAPLLWPLPHQPLRTSQSAPRRLPETEAQQIALGTRTHQAPKTWDEQMKLIEESRRKSEKKQRAGGVQREEREWYDAWEH
ncbi:hypothetical protein LTS18_005413 [Coniosporium uncinatum]|uniref:Uncharacterized protein n=1 Tax=Coniosporium uncinatum TaxID=93489 RepID=A0ACC3DRA2_9PEZI|nr:hypothetical protein LTS18_005413 [Coniosporium uncinatum]